MDASQQLRQVIAQLTLVSHAATQNLEPTAHSTDEDIGGRRPSGGISRKDDRDEAVRQKSADHFARRASGCRSERDFELVLADAIDALDAWKRTPIPDSPTLDHPQWKQWAANSPLPAAEIARLYSVTRQYVHRVRRQYRQAA